ncbi:mitochondrial carrier [Sistotremastrum niveocremeum HHB9708]|uniref:Mitochondrial carrier n=1 Tax=Sistotremastrum niveocremeum HHB9708 TaxID=1314777 RepID=A0A164X8D1_9AGAM|nr:mitochondrial carrier [Sistotremastrum niveocremeum HHB9708]
MMKCLCTKSKMDKLEFSESHRVIPDNHGAEIRNLEKSRAQAQAKSFSCLNRETQQLRSRLPSGHEADKSTKVSASSSTASSIKSFISGGFGGVCAVLVGHPFDLTKTRLQTAPPGAYTGAVDVVRKTLARDGVSGLYRGIVPPILGVTPIFAVSFWGYDLGKKLVYAYTPNRTSKQLSTAEVAAAGFFSAIPQTFVAAPVERAKVLLQIQGQGQSGPKYNGVIDVVRGLYREGGIRSIFRGTGATLARDGPGSAAYFAAYEVTKKYLTPAGSSPSELNLGAVIIAGGMAGVAMWSIAIPPDVLKSRLQSAPTGTYSGFLDCARKTIATDGVKALWKGFGPAMARAFPANAATFLGVEASRVLLDKLF